MATSRSGTNVIGVTRMLAVLGTILMVAAAAWEVVVTALHAAHSTPIVKTITPSAAAQQILAGFFACAVAWAVVKCSPSIGRWAWFGLLMVLEGLIIFSFVIGVGTTDSYTPKWVDVAIQVVIMGFIVLPMVWFLLRPARWGRPKPKAVRST